MFGNEAEAELTWMLVVGDSLLVASSMCHVVLTVVTPTLSGPPECRTSRMSNDASKSRESRSPKVSTNTFKESK